VTHEVYPGVLAIEESAIEADALACLPGASGNPLRLYLTSKSGNPVAVKETDIPEILVCYVRRASPAIECGIA